MDQYSQYLNNYIMNGETTRSNFKTLKLTESLLEYDFVFKLETSVSIN